MVKWLSDRFDGLYCGQLDKFWLSFSTNDWSDPCKQIHQHESIEYILLNMLRRFFPIGDVRKINYLSQKTLNSMILGSVFE